jgi:hypothetical protein
MIVFVSLYNYCNGILYIFIILLPKGEHQTRFSGTPSNLKEDDPL